MTPQENETSLLIPLCPSAKKQEWQERWRILIQAGKGTAFVKILTLSRGTGKAQRRLSIAQLCYNSEAVGRN